MVQSSFGFESKLLLFLKEQWVNFNFHLILTAFEMFMHWNPMPLWTYIVSITSENQYFNIF